MKMKKYCFFSKKPISGFLFILILAFNHLSASAQQITVHVPLPGELSSLIASTKKNEIVGLKLTGDLNALDIRFVNEMKKLEILDLSDANFVFSSGEYYNGKAPAAIGNVFKANVISKWMFAKHDNYKSIIIPHTVFSIENTAFSFCKKLESVTFGDNLKSITDDSDYYNDVFAVCYALKNIYVSEKNTVYASESGVLLSKDKKKLLFYPPAHASSYVIPETVEELGYNSMPLGTCRILVIPESVKTFASQVVPSGNNITKIYIRSSIPPLISDNTFSMGSAIKKNCYLCVPKGSRNAYWLAKGWGDFSHIIEEDYNPTHLEKIEWDDINIFVEGTHIRMTGNRSETVFIYSSTGKLIYKGKDERIPLYSGVFFLKIGKTTKKILIPNGC